MISQGKVQARVRLDFEAGGKEYTAVRVVRRLASGGASTKEAVLEERVDGGASRTLASTEKELSRQVTDEVIGLGLDHFTKCVVLPQGEFATFLRVNPGERQKLLGRLLGLGLYDRLQREANRRAGAHASRAEALDARLGSDLAGATAEAVREAAERVAELAGLGERIEEAEGELSAMAEAVRKAKAGAAEAQRLLSVLAAVEVPADAEALSSRHVNAEAALRDAREAVETASEALRKAREALAALPERAFLKGILDKRSELARRNVEVGQAWQDVADAEQTLADLADATPRAVLDAKARVIALEELGGQIRDAEPGLQDLAEAASEARDRGAAAARRRSALAGVRVPEGAAALSDRRRDAETALRDVRQAWEAATRRHVGARKAREALPERAFLVGVRDRRVEFAALEDVVGHLRQKVADNEVILGDAVSREEAADLQLATCTAALETLRRAHGAADLARHLEEGEPCPVCLREVAELPRRDAPAGLEAAHDAKAEAEAACRRASEQRRGLERRRDGVAAKLAERENSAAKLRESLLGDPSREEVAAGMAKIVEMESDLGAAEAAEEAARGARSGAEAALAEAESRLAPAWRGYHEVRDGVAEMKPPRATDDDLAASWTKLSAWALALAADLANVVTAAASEAEAKTSERGRREAELRELCRSRGLDLYDGVDPGKRCAEAQGGARENVRRVEARLEERSRAEANLDQATRRAKERTDAARTLETSLADAPSPAEITTLLAKIGEAESDLRAAEGGERAARGRVDAAKEELAGLESRLRVAWRDYRDERDRLAGMKPPPARENDLVGSWGELSRWSESHAAELRDAVAAAASEAEAKDAERRRCGAELREHCRAHDLDIGEGDAPANRCAEALGSARESLHHLRAAAEERKRIAAAAKTARKRAVVAKDLGRHLSATGFGRWLQNQVLKWLVGGATLKLRELSSGQYSLDMDARNEFLVIDHRNADEPRTAKTLSGGETFLASLALALSLAEQVAGLAARGSARLEALFLDEGFGALDPETLDVVATSIEQLGADRMVGLVTHVSELADRIPIQYRVKKVGNCSSVERVEI